MKLGPHAGAALSVSAALIGGVATAAAPLQGQQPPARLAQFLRHSIGLDSAQLLTIGGGKAIVKVLDTPVKRDVAIFGIISVDVPREAYVARVRDVRNSLRTPTRSRFGIFSDPATPADVREVTLRDEDVGELKECQPGKCDWKVPATEMERIRQEIDWSAADPAAQVNAWVQRRMVTYVTDYRARGDSALVVYDDVGHVRASDAFAALLAQSPYVYEYVPPLHRHLASYPHDTLAGVSDVLYWSEDALPGLKPILSITHLSLYTPPGATAVTVIAAKQIYGDHYFEAAFELLVIVDRPVASAPQGIYLVFVRRFRFDDLPSGLFNIRGKVIGKLRDNMWADLEREKATSERALER
ncbi:MAG TPA: hypothetical protein VF976_11925 [Gemmatimonadales bacterium]